MGANIALSGPSSARQQNAIEMTQRECWLGSFVIFQLIRTSIAMIPSIFIIFLGGEGSPDPLSPPASLDPPMCLFALYLPIKTSRRI